MEKTLKAFWIEYPAQSCKLRIFTKDKEPSQGLMRPEKPATDAIGVTAFSIDDAQELITKFGYSINLRSSEVKIQSDIRPDQLDNYVQQSMGPIVVRGVWFPLQFGIGA